MNVLLTGGAGYIGSHTAVVLWQSSHRVVLYDNLSNSSDAVLEKLTQITGQPIPFIEGDVRDTDLLKDTLAAHRIDAVVHFAGLKAVGESVEKPVDYYANNVQGTISLLQAMQSAQVKTLVFSSSATVYGEPQYLPLDESHPTSATNPYGRSKLHIEEILKDVAASDPAWRMACLRYFNPVGAHESGLIGENPTLHRKVHRPWGWYDSIDEGGRFKVKRIQVKPGASLSMQKHHHRAEHWVVVNGTAEITCGDKKLLLTENQSTYIPLGEVHRLANPGTVPLEIIEVQSGSYLGEDDIVRFEDHYGRSQA